MMFKRDANLQTMCLSVVADKINIFSIPNTSIEIYIQFLRRCYSDKLFELIEKRCSSKKYLVWLISPHWKNVSLPGRGYKYSDVLLKMKCVGDKITSLSLEDSACSFDMLSAIICCLPKLTTLNLSGTSFRNNILQLIRRMCPNLQTLDLSNCSCLTDEGLKTLCSFDGKNHNYPSLKVLNLISTCIRIQTIYFILNYLTSLEILNHHCLITTVRQAYNLSQASMTEDIPKYNIKYLEFRISPIESITTLFTLDPTLEAFLTLCPFINHIFIQDKIFKSSLQLLTKFECLKKLKLLNTGESFEAPSTSPCLTIKGPMLTHLEIFQLSVSADVITKSCPNLEYLLLCGVVFEDFKPTVTSRKIPELKHLKTLVIKHIHLDYDLPFKSISLLISSSENLNDVSIQYAQSFTDTVADVILKLPNLLTVDFSFTDIKTETLLRFFTHPDVNKICSDGCPNISLNDNSSCILKLLSHTQYGNTCSWEINYFEPVKRH